ncbi:hypothetical protein [Sphingosinicella sp. BN140058]|uniref:hypothetical protein n=1 Tax=Sphingosinicella sp. BN140058 TaxID=1892855 RepID=UPI0010132BF9|nr:hypothetical protein [Sphingosinicella sp. BN140058]QAY77906.1 hypothetical protein ETR14_16295 [Sphingosinicella sp. BN140058]
MASRVHGEVDNDDAQTALYRALEFFPTPPWAARAGGELIKLIDPEARTVWEPACGQGHMAAALDEYFGVFASDVHPFGHGAVLDFLDEGIEPPECDWIVTNPPFPSAGKFLRLGLRRARRGVAMLVRLAFLEGGERSGRYRMLYGADPLSLCAVFSERPAMLLGRWEPKASTATAYAWLLWRKGEVGPPQLRGIPPGTRARLTRPDDAARFGWKTEAGLLVAMGGRA